MAEVTIGPLKELKNLKDNIFTPEEFDNKFQDPNFASKVAAVGTYSLSHLKKGLGVDGVSLKGTPRFGSNIRDVELDLVPSINSSLYPGRPVYHQPEEIVKRNRKFGEYWGARDAAIEFSGTDYIINVSTVNQNLFPLIQQPIPNNLNLLQFLKSALPVYDNRDNYHKLNDLYNILLSTFRSERQCFDFFAECKRRKGVQVIIGPKDNFLKFVKGTQHEPVDDESTSIEGDIPADLVWGILPLGEYEREKLKDA